MRTRDHRTLGSRQIDPGAVGRAVLPSVSPLVLPSVLPSVLPAAWTAGRVRRLRGPGAQSATRGCLRRLGGVGVPVVGPRVLLCAAG